VEGVLTKSGAASPLCMFAVATPLVTGCTTPIGATKTSLRVAYRQAQASAMRGEASSESRLVLHRFDLDKQFASHPAAASRKPQPRTTSR
jgi:hypothetical protein